VVEEADALVAEADPLVAAVVEWEEAVRRAAAVAVVAQAAGAAGAVSSFSPSGASQLRGAPFFY
jgi:hypothetical protein